MRPLTFYCSKMEKAIRKRRRVTQINEKSFNEINSHALRFESLRKIKEKMNSHQFFILKDSQKLPTKILYLSYRKEDQGTKKSQANQRTKR